MLCSLLAAFSRMTRHWWLKQLRSNLNKLNSDVTPPIVVEVNSNKQCKC